MTTPAEVLSPSMARIPAFPPIASQVLGLLSDTPTTEVAAVVERDAAFSAQLLAMANSPAFSCGGGQVKTLPQAVAQIGFVRLRAIAFTIALRSVMRLVLNRPVPRQCWAHSLACGLLARTLSEPAGLDPDEIYTLGLFHEVGRLGLLALAPDEYSRVLSRRFESEQDLLSSESRLFGVDHETAGAWLAGHWELPPALRPAPEEPSAVFVRKACRLAVHCGFAVPAVASIPGLSDPQLALDSGVDPGELKSRLFDEMAALRLA